MAMPKRVTMNHEKVADTICFNHLNGNITDAVDSLFELSEGDALIVAMIIGRDYSNDRVSSFISAIFNRMGIE